MEPVVFNLHTGELVSGKIEPIPTGWFVENVLLPFIDWNEQYLKYKEYCENAESETEV